MEFCQLCDWTARVNDVREALNHAWCKHWDETLHDVFGPGLVIQCDYGKCANATADMHSLNPFAVALANGWKFTSDGDGVNLGLDNQLFVTYEYCPLHSGITFETIGGRG